MSPTEIKAALNGIDIRVDQIEDADTRAAVLLLLDLVERLASGHAELKEENQRLKDEINRLKGEQGKPEVNAGKPQSGDISSEEERRDAEGTEGKKTRNRKPKIPDIKIDREVICPVNRDELPEDAVLKGHDEVVIQEIKITTDNVKYLVEVFHSPSQKKTWRGALPKEVAGKGEFGPGIRTLIPVMKSECNMSEPKIHGFMENFGIRISPAYISTLWTGPRQEVFHQEKDEIYRAGLESGGYQQIDDTGGKVNGTGRHVQIVCNENYTAYFTTERKDRLTILDVFNNFAPRRFVYNEEARDLLKTLGLSAKMTAAADKHLEKDKELDEECFNRLLDEIKPGPKQRTRILEACAIAAYHRQTDFPVIARLVSDDAGQFKLLTEEQGLCWIHDGRHYKRLNPIVPYCREQLEKFRARYWEYYKELVVYKQNPGKEEEIRLSDEFDRLFSTRTGYGQLDDRIAKTLAKKTELLLVLRYPELPLHNNAAELAARVQVRSRDVSLQTKSEAGTKAKDTFMTITQTAKKLDVSPYEYVYDRVSDKFEMPSLAELIRQRNRFENRAQPQGP